VVVNANGKLGTIVSSARVKEATKPMDKVSEAILQLEPVTFRYKEELDPEKIPQFGLVAEQVEKVNPDLVVRDQDGKVTTVRYEAVNAMLLNEFLESIEQSRNSSLLLRDRTQRWCHSRSKSKRLLQVSKSRHGKSKVSDELEVSKAMPQTVAENQ
jgi:hypothetical protein